ncbi:MAG: 2-iminobutanoate/2-iminopropanoate deaminase [Actinomycetota bacterium]|jgi:2-iminobutanoate/2-iminopropanoate deaminase|nr:2-iminobutanoate/2-iminopropanoate deaminase [Actinomycetota bacterium]
MTLPAAPYSAARRSGDLLFVSGQLGVTPGGPPADVTTQTEVALERLAAVLAEHGATAADVVKCTVFLADMADWPAMNAVYERFFAQPYPARSALGVELALGALVEIEAVADVARS